MTESSTYLVAEADLPALRAAVSRLAGLGYNEVRVRERLGLADLNDLWWRALPIYRAERLADRDPLASAIDLFQLQGVISSEELDRLFESAAREVLVRTGLIVVDESGFARARAGLFPVGDRLVFSDHAWPNLPHPGQAEARHDQVMYVGTDSRWLARATVRRPVAAALDLCTGSGVHALLAAPHAQKVVAVDINPRAAQCARFNAQLAGADNIEIAVGSLFEPVQGRRFGLITANPPFVPSPLDAVGFRDGGRSGEEALRQIVAGLPLYLERGGIAQIVTELGERENEPLADRLREWLGGAPLDIHVLRLRTHSAATYAVGHAHRNETLGAYFEAVHEWAANLKSQGYVRIVSALLAFKWSDPALNAPWTRTEDAQPPLSDAGSEVEATFLAEYLSRKPNLRDLLERRSLRRAGPIGLIETRILGKTSATKTQAQLLGMRIPISHWLDATEREVALLLQEPLAWHDLLELARGLSLDEEAVTAAVASLLRRRLLLLSAVDPPALPGQK